MKALKEKGVVPYLSPGTMTVLEELGEECQQILKLLVRMELPGLAVEQVENLLGELSASILHLHEHTRGLDELIDRDTCQG